jgi:predicted HicB family RNase H-like nuclease
VKTKESTETLTLRVPTSVKLQIEMAAHKDGRTINSWVNKVIREYFETKKNKE